MCVGTLYPVPHALHHAPTFSAPRSAREGFAPPVSLLRTTLSYFLAAGCFVLVGKSTLAPTPHQSPSAISPNPGPRPDPKQSRLRGN